MAAVVVGGLLALSACLPPEHGHADAEGRTTVVHRHASLHAVRGLSSFGVSGAEALVIRIDNAYLSPASSSVTWPDRALADRPAVHVPVISASRVPLELRAGGIHGPPPRPAAPRAPPSSPVL